MFTEAPDGQCTSKTGASPTNAVSPHPCYLQVVLTQDVPLKILPEYQLVLHCGYLIITLVYIL